MNSQDAVVVACAANAAYALPMAVMLRSAADNLSPERRLVVWIVDDGLGDDLRQRITRSLPEKVTVKWLTPNRSDLDGVPLIGGMPITTYDKVMIAELLPHDVAKVIWLDCDMLVLVDLAELWDVPLGESHALAVTDALVGNVSSRFGVTRYAELGLDGSASYFNAGVIVIDPAKWRESRIANSAIAYLKRFRRLVFFWDQEALNVVLAGLWTPIESRWNWSATIDRISDGNGTSPMNDRIVHFNGNLKPWIVRETWDLDSIYYDIVDRTAWRGWRPESTLTRSILAWYGSSRIRRIAYPAEQWGMQAVWRIRQRNA
ncbi:MAG: glycosyltransferase family 8 protein [Gemmatimonadales bacterium]